MPEVLVAAEGASRSYGERGSAVEALAGATCRVRAGDRIALVGASGSGKSTLLHLMGGLDEPTAGAVRWPALGERRTLRPARVAFVFQTPSLLPSLTALENVALPLVLGGAAEVARARAREALERLELEHLADKLPEELSGGQAQRIAVARALSYQPRLILADEPTGQLDHATAQHLLDVWLNALEGTDTALVVATHDAAAARRMHTCWTIAHGVLDAGTRAAGVAA